MLWFIVYYFGVRGDYWTITRTLCVCIKFFVCGCVCGMCVCMHTISLFVNGSLLMAVEEANKVLVLMECSTEGSLSVNN